MRDFEIAQHVSQIAQIDKSCATPTLVFYVNTHYSQRTDCPHQSDQRQFVGTRCGKSLSLLQHCNVEDVRIRWRSLPLSAVIYILPYSPPTSCWCPLYEWPRSNHTTVYRLHHFTAQRGLSHRMHAKQFSARRANNIRSADRDFSFTAMIVSNVNAANQPNKSDGTHSAPIHSSATMLMYNYTYRRPFFPALQ